MPNEFASKPELLDNFPAPVRVWKCPLTGLVVPKDPTQNLVWRAKMLEAAEQDTRLQTDLYTACSRSVLFFVNAFCFTYRLFQSNPDGTTSQAEHAHVPYVTWAIQDKHITAVSNAITEGTELLTDKSRDMGATWDHIAVYTHRFLFRAGESHLMLSRKEASVDQLSGLPKNYPFGAVADPGTLFGKVDYILSRLPAWMIPAMNRKLLHLTNLDNGSRIDGESANASAGSSDRRTSIFLDEMAKMDEGESIKRSTRDVTACRLPCSTPNGAGTTYSKWRMSGTVPVFVLAWWEHPEKGRGRYVKQDDLGRWKIRSPWYDAEAEARSPKELAIEVDMDHVGSGDTFFEGAVIEEHRLLFARPANSSVKIEFDPKLAESDISAAIRRRRPNAVRRLRGTTRKWQLWTHLINGRPDQKRTYTLACDISKGMGASNSTCTVVCNETKEKIASFADANIPPYEFAKQVVAACLWFGGRKLPLLIWENNGDPGFDFGRQIVHVYEYPAVYFDRVAGTVSERAGRRYGWRSSPEKKAGGLGMLRRAYAHGGFINHDADSLDEALTYITFENGSIGPAALTEESASARKTHGDRVIADMLAVIATEQTHSADLPAPGAPRNSVGHRLREYQRGKSAAKRERRFDFRVQRV